jgi:hypothetical protein
MAKSVYVKDKNGTAVSGTVSYVDIPDASGSTAKSRFYAADGTLTIAQNGTVDVREQATVTVAVPVESSASGEANPVKEAPEPTIYLSEEVTLDGTTIAANQCGVFVIEKPATTGVYYYRDESQDTWYMKEIFIIYASNGKFTAIVTVTANSGELISNWTCNITSGDKYLYFGGNNTYRVTYKDHTNTYVGKYIPLTALGASE